MTRLTLLLSLMVGGMTPQALAAQAAERPDSSRFFFKFAFSFAPNRVMRLAPKFDQRLELTRSLRSNVARAVTTTSARFMPLRLELAERQAALDALLARPELDRDEAMRAFDRVVMVETELKRLQMKLLLTTHATLSPAQRREMLREMRRDQ